MASIELKNVHKNWGQFIAVDDFNLTISDRALYTGTHTGLGTTTKVYALGTPLEIVLHEMV